MDIDWAEIFEKPEKGVKVPGQLLLQQRNKIESMQKELDELRSAIQNKEKEEYGYG